MVRAADSGFENRAVAGSGYMILNAGLQMRHTTIWNSLRARFQARM